MNCRLTQQGDLTAACQVQSEVETVAAILFSAALLAQGNQHELVACQLSCWAGLARNQFMLINLGTKQSAQWSLKALCFRKWSRALALAMWHQVSPCLPLCLAFVDVASLHT